MTRPATIKDVSILAHWTPVALTVVATCKCIVLSVSATKVSLAILNNIVAKVRPANIFGQSFLYFILFYVIDTININFTCSAYLFMLKYLTYFVNLIYFACKIDFLIYKSFLHFHQHELLQSVAVAIVTAH